MTQLTTKTAKELKAWKDNFNFNNKLRIDAVINFKNELKEINQDIEHGYIGDTLFRTKIENLIQEIEQVEKDGS